MKLSDFIKYTLSERKISIKDASAMLGYTEPSFRNKLTKNNLNLRDIIILGLLTDIQLSFGDDTKTQEFKFDPFDYLQPSDIKRLQSFIISNLQSKEYTEWFKSLPESEKEKIYSKYHEEQTQPKKKLIGILSKKEGYSIFSGIKQNYSILGTEHAQALQYIIEYKNNFSEMTENEEKRMILKTMNRFNVVIRSEPKEEI